VGVSWCAVQISDHMITLWCILTWLNIKVAIISMILSLLDVQSLEVHVRVMIFIFFAVNPFS